MTTEEALQGVFPVLQTPFDKSGRIDHVTLTKEIDWVFDCGASGVTVAMVSEILRLEHQERRQLAEVVCEAARSRGPAIVSVGAESTSVAVGLAEHAQSAGAAAVMAIPPLSVSPTHAELERYYEAILGAVNVPLVVQDASSYVGEPISLDLMARLHHRHPDRIYFKPEAQPLGPKLSELLEITGGAARVYDGSGGVALIETFRRGIVGTMPSADISWAIVAMWEALRSGEDELAYKVGLPLAALLALESGLDGYIAINKYLLLKQAVFSNAARRGPLGFELDSTTVAEVDTLFRLLKSAAGRGDGARTDEEQRATAQSSVSSRSNT